MFFPHGSDVYDEEILMLDEIGKDGNALAVIYARYDGGGECYEFYAGRLCHLDGATEVYRSDMGYGDFTTAAIDAYIFALTGALAIGDDPSEQGVAV